MALRSDITGTFTDAPEELGDFSNAEKAEFAVALYKIVAYMSEQAKLILNQGERNSVLAVKVNNPNFMSLAALYYKDWSKWRDIAIMSGYDAPIVDGEVDVKIPTKSINTRVLTS